MAGLGAKDILRNVTALEQLIEEINFQRAKEMRQCLMSKDSDTGFVMVQGTTYWTDLFVRHFLFQTDRSTDADDLLFFIRKKQIKGSRYIPKYQTEVEVYRRDSRKLPIGDPDIDWEETVYLNLIIHQFDYTLTLAVCTRTSPKDLQVLRRHSQKVYASPSRRRMDTKGEVEEITYPSVCFHVDNFDEVFADMLVRDGEMVCVELVAADHAGTRQAVIFLGSIRYDALKRVYDARASLSSKVAQRMMMGLFAGNSNQRIEFVRMKGPQGKGHAEMAVTKPKGSGVETPTSEPGVSLTDMWDCDWEDEPEDRFIYRHQVSHSQRRLSDPSANFNTFINSGWKSRPEGARSRSENEGLDYFADGLYEIESGDVRDAVCSGRCCSVVACNTIREEEETPQAVHCSKCHHFHGDQTVSSNPNPPSLRVLAARQVPSSAQQDARTSILSPHSSKLPNQPLDSRPQSPQEDSPLLASDTPSKSHSSKLQTLDLSSRPQSPQEDSPLLQESSAEPKAIKHVQSTINSEPKSDATPSVPDRDTNKEKDGDFDDDTDSPAVRYKVNKYRDKNESQKDGTELCAGSLSEEEAFVMIVDPAKSTGGVTETSFICKDIQEQIVKANKSNLSLNSLTSSTEPPKKSPSPTPKNRVSPVSPRKSRNKRPGSAQRIHSPATSEQNLFIDKSPDTPVKTSHSLFGSFEDLSNERHGKKPTSTSRLGATSNNSPDTPIKETCNLLGSFEDLSNRDNENTGTPSTSRLGATSPLSDDEITESSKLLGSPGPSKVPLRSDPLGALGNMEGVEKPQFLKSLSIDSVKAGTNLTKGASDLEGIETASDSLTALNLSPVKKKKKVTVPYRMTPDGLKVNYLCDIQLDDGAYNPLWTTKGFTQTFHFWKESRRQQSVPLNAYLTYVTLPWFTIITDILDHRTGPILTF